MTEGKEKMPPWLVVLIVLFVLLGWWVTQGEGAFDTPPPRPQVVYTVSGGGKGEQVSIHYTNRTGGTDDILATMPWSYRFTLPPGGEYLRLFVHRKGQFVGGRVRATISVGGQVLEEAQTNDGRGSAMVSEHVR